MDRPWIPVTMTDGSFLQLSIKEAFAQANEIRSIDGDIPLQRFALCRLLLAIIYGTFGHLRGSGITDWKTLFNDGVETRNACDALMDYCDYYRNRFDLFDDTAPFYQVAGLHTAKNEVSGLERLVLDVPNGEKFFTTRSGEGLATMGVPEGGSMAGDVASV